MIDDGTYDAFVLDAEDGRSDDGTPLLHLSVTILNGPYKGEVIDLTAAGLAHDVIDILGMPATLTVTDGRPALRIDDI